MKKKQNQKGFTLIELALIIAVLGILGAVGAVKLTSMTTEANAAAQKTVIANARSGLAIALAKDEDKDGKVRVAELARQLENVTATSSTTITMDGYTINLSGTADDVTGITSATK